MNSNKQLWSVALSVTCLKVLLIPSYRSTDFEVHRNWLAITHNLDISKWYYEATSEWTLDYPPLFAWMEYAFSQAAKFFDPKMLQISAKAYDSWNTTVFQRMTVIATDLFYYYAAFQWCEIISRVKRMRIQPSDQWFNPNIILAMLFLWNPGLLIVDHIHFQYNGLLSGLMLLSIARMFQRRELESSLYFAILLNMKHIYLYMAPAYFVFLLRNYCFDRHFNFKRKKFFLLSVTVGSVFFLSFGPFVVMGQLGQVLSRLFPFKRGLSHAYWAPNFWAIYNTLDKGLSFALKPNASTASMTGGLVQQFDHQVLMNITPMMTLLLVGLSMVPTLNLLWNLSHNSSPIHFVRSVIICAFCSFMFGWHVHEKAILLVLLPLIPLAMLSENDAKIFVIVSTVGHFSLFPLLYKEAETLTKILLLLIYCVYAFKSLEMLYLKSKANLNLHNFRFPLLNSIESIYLLSLIPMQLFYSFANFIPVIKHYQFVPLLLMSFYCSLGVSYGFVKFYLHSLRGK